MAIKIGINGFGRMGRLALRAAWDWDEVEFVQIPQVMRIHWHIYSSLILSMVAGVIP